MNVTITRTRESSLDTLRSILDSLHEDLAAGAGIDTPQARLARASRLLQRLDAITALVASAPERPEWTDADALTMRACLDIYERAVLELRSVALDARRRITEAEGTLAEARGIGRRARRRIERATRTRAESA